MLIAASISVLFLALQPADGEIEVEISTALDVLESRWLGADFHGAAEAATAALELIEASECPLRDDVAIVSFIGGVTGIDHSALAKSGYMFWVATQTHAQLDILTPDLVSVAEAEQSPPGYDIRLDQYFLGSPYREAPLVEECAPAQLDPEMLFADVPVVDHAFIAFAMPERDIRRGISPERVLYAYPASVSETIGAALLETENWISTGGRVAVLTPGPCDRYLNSENLYEDVCLEPSSPANVP
jgi:hypothetical protein